MFRCGYIALIGRPNVGKSTLLNRLLGQKLSITADKPQTTRHRIVGIKTVDDAQFLYVDTPGLHTQAKKAMNRYLNRAASSALYDVDAVAFVVEAQKWTDDDQAVLERLQEVSVPVFAVVNKVDRVKDKTALLPFLQALGERFAFAEIVPVSAQSGSNVERLEQALKERLPEGEPVYDAEQLTDRPSRFIAAELIREKLTRRLQRELPYALTVEIEQFKEQDDVLHIDGLIWVERDSQKSIVIGKGGAMLKEVGRQARADMEKTFGAKVFLRLWVKAKEGWSDDERSLKNLGYSDEF